MFKSIKAEAKLVVSRNYGYVIFPSLLFMSANAFTHLIINYFYTPIKWDFLSEWQQYACFYALIIFKLIILPISITMLYKIYMHSANNNLSFKNVFGSKGWGRMVVIDFIPNMLSLVLLVNNSKISNLNLVHLEKPVIVVLAVVSIYINYKLFVAKYYVIYKDFSLKDALLQSFKMMNCIFGKYLLLIFSFIGWFIIQAVVYATIKFCVYSGSYDMASIYSPSLDFINWYGFGINFYLTPYIYFTYLSFIIDYIDKKQF